MKPTNYAEKVRRRKQFLKQNKVKPVELPKKSRAIWILRLAGVFIALIALLLIAVIAIFLIMLYIDTELRAEWLSYDNLIILLSVVAIILLLPIIWAVVWVGPKIYVRSLQKKSLNNNQSEFDREKETLKLEDDTRKTFAQLVGGAVFLFVTLFAYNTFVLNREGQITDRFNDAMAHLGKEEITVRLGGLYALERIAKDSPKDHWTIMEILSSYIREKRPIHKPANPAETDQKTQSNSASNNNPANPPAETDQKTQSNSASNNKPANPAEPDRKKQSNSTEAKQAENEAIKTDVQAALTIIGRRVSQQDPPTTKSSIDLSDVDLRRANLYRADLKDANLNRSNLNKATFIGADLTEAAFVAADLSGGYLMGANLSGADLNRANLKSANLIRATLRRADFEYAFLNGANFSGADLEGALNLTYEQIVTAIIDENTILPKYLESRRQELLDISRKQKNKIE